MWKTCSNCSYFWLSNPNPKQEDKEKCPMCGRFNQRILDIEAELRKTIAREGQEG
jgi:hypothetical protein